MKRTMIQIDPEKCVGCGLCVSACHQGAIGLRDGKAVLLKEDYCDGLGRCLPVCPTNAISFSEREIVAIAKTPDSTKPPHGGCSSAKPAILAPTTATPSDGFARMSCLAQWPVQLQLVPVTAPYFENAQLLIAADCAAFAYGNFHADFMADHVTLIGCPKLDQVESAGVCGDYTEKLTAILAHNHIQSVTVVRMEVPCCAGIATAVTRAVSQCGKTLPCRVVTLSTEGAVLQDQQA